MSFKQRRDGAPGPPLTNQKSLFDSLVDWVENESAPDLIVVDDLGGKCTARIRKYPNATAHFHVGDPLNHAIYL